MVQKALKIIDSSQSVFRGISDYIHANPETGMVEYKAAARLVEELGTLGFSVTAPFSSLETAFRAEKSFGAGGPHICFLCEYDALPEIGHACGHNLIAAAAVAGACAAAEMMAESALSGTISVIGTPAEEGIGGKVMMLRDGAFEDVDYVLLSHPFAYTAIDPGALAVSRYIIRFSGRESHAAAAPSQGVNALDAVNLLFAGVNAWRQQFPPGGMVHGIITDGGVVPNIIPGSAEAKFYIRSESLETQAAMEQRFTDIVAGAALMTGCEYELDRGDTPYEPTRLNHELSEHVFNLAEALDMNPRRDMPEKISTDFGNVSQQVIGVNFFFGICKESDTNAPPLHSPGFLAAAATDYAFNQAMKAAAIMATAAINILRGNCLA